MARSRIIPFPGFFRQPTVHNMALGLIENAADQADKASAFMTAARVELMDKGVNRKDLAQLERLQSEQRKIQADLLALRYGIQHRTVSP